LLDRRRAWALKREALGRIWAAARSSVRSAADAALSADPVLHAFAAFTVAVEQHGEGWQSWPDGLRHPDGSGWPRFRQEHGDRIAFHAWVQAEVAAQLAALATEVTVLGDLAVGTDPAGFDAWYWQDVFVLDGTRIGAPADLFNTLGQDWGLPPLDPWRLRAHRYEPFVRMLRCGLGVGHGLRIDHVMGLFRLFWIPAGAAPVDGVYVRQPADELLALIALESARASAWVIGEDLGTVEPGVRETLAAHGLLSYRVMSLEEAPPETYPERSLATVSTHDLPTIAGFWTGTDLADQERLGLQPPVEETRAARARFAHRIGVAEDGPVADAVVAAYEELARSPSLIVLAQVEDAGLVAERPNMPGTTDQWPNWSLALPAPIEEVLATELAARVADAIACPAEPGRQG
jgi:4-alpha-glucanotransferase